MRWTDIAAILGGIAAAVAVFFGIFGTQAFRRPAQRAQPQRQQQEVMSPPANKPEAEPPSSLPYPQDRPISFEDSKKMFKVQIHRTLFGQAAVDQGGFLQTQLELDAQKMGKTIVCFDVSVTNQGAAKTQTLLGSDFTLEDTKGNSYASELPQDSIRGDVHTGRTARGGIGFYIYPDAVPAVLIYDTGYESERTGKKIYARSPRLDARDTGTVAPAPASSPAKIVQQPSQPAKDLPGYKGAQWGMGVAQAGQALHSSLSPVGEAFGTGPKSAAGDWIIKTVFYELWGVPKGKVVFTGMPFYEEDYVPAKFRAYRTKGSDFVSFYSGKLYAYYFEAHAKNYDQLLSKLTGQYGPPHNTSTTFNHPSATTQEDAEPHEYLIHTWDLGRTILHLARRRSQALGMIYTHVHLIYESRDIRKKIVAAIQQAANKERSDQKRKEAAQQDEDIGKLQ